MGFRDQESEHLFSHPLTVVYYPVILDTEFAPQATANTLKVSWHLILWLYQLLWLFYLFIYFYKYFLEVLAYSKHIRK